MQHPVRGFTLIELSIVLVIIGLIVGGVLVGRDLINAAGVRAEISQIEKYQTAANTFRGKYGALPGDIPASYASQFGFKPRGTLAGQGDGNGLIESSQNWGLNEFQGEQAMFWVDLSTARLIDGSFNTATSTAIVSTSITGTAINNYLPQTKIGNGGGYVYVWSGGWQEIVASMSGGTGGDGTNYFAISAVTGGATGPFNSDSEVTLLTVAQAYAIDKKIDDGFPQLGNVTAIAGTIANTTMGSAPVAGWATSGQLGGPPAVEVFAGDADPATGGPVVAGDGEATAGPNQGMQTTCYDNNNVGGATETYSLGNAAMVNCWLSFRFQ